MKKKKVVKEVNTALRQEMDHPAIADTLKYKVRQIVEYYPRVPSNVDGREAMKHAIALMYTENNVVDKVEIKGETMFICKL